MKYLIIFMLLFMACDDDPGYTEPECIVGNWKCENNKSYFCNKWEWWETWQDCTSIEQTCYYNNPEMSGGFTGLATCAE